MIAIGTVPFFRSERGHDSEIRIGILDLEEIATRFVNGTASVKTSGGRLGLGTSLGFADSIISGLSLHY